MPNNLHDFANVKFHIFVTHSIIIEAKALAVYFVRQSHMTPDIVSHMYS